ncbi:MAG: ABC transporter ATP-binding protein [Armatimonadota bacterium]|nr:ABC transporter ATP-binding protein [Armatimonadota bacterium]
MDGVAAMHQDLPLLQVTALCKQYRSGSSHLVAVQDATLSLQRGEIVCLLGPSGCGKSSLLLTVAGLQPADGGQILLEGQPLTQPHPQVGVVFQEPCLLPWRTVWANVALGLQLVHQALPKAAIAQRVHRALCLVGLEQFAQHYPHQLSGGMAQRVALARALVRQPVLLLMDEPFAALDAPTRQHLRCLLLQVVHQLGTAVLMVTHDIDEAIFLADRVLLMGARPGRIEAEWHISLPHPRLYRDPQMLRLHAAILDRLAEHTTLSGKEVVDWVI